MREHVEVLVPQEEEPAESRGVGGSSFWSKDEPTLDGGAVRKGGMFPHQAAWWDLPNFVRLLVGGYGSGKTLILSKRMISLALINAPYPVAVVSPTYGIARQTTISMISELLDGKAALLGRDNFHWGYNRTFHEFTIQHHQKTGKLIVYSGEDPDSLRGFNLAAAGIDEPFIQEEAVFNQMLARVRRPGARKLEINLTGTPEQLNWGYELAEGELSGKHDVGVIHAGTEENKALDPEYAKRLYQAYDEKAAAAYVKGQFVSLGTGLVYYGFNPMEHLVELPIPDGAEVLAGMDFNVNPMACVVFWRLRDHLHAFEEFELPNADTEFLCSLLKEKFGERLRTITPDATGKDRHTSSPGGKSDFNFIRDAGYEIRCHPSNPKRRDRYNAVNGKFKPRGGRFTLTVSSRCKRLKKYLSVYSHDLMKKEEQEAMSHLLDAFSYPIAYHFPVDRTQFAQKPLRGV